MATHLSLNFWWMRAGTGGPSSVLMATVPSMPKDSCARGKERLAEAKRSGPNKPANAKLQLCGSAGRVRRHVRSACNKRIASMHNVHDARPLRRPHCSTVDSFACLRGGGACPPVHTRHSGQSTGLGVGLRKRASKRGTYQRFRGAAAVLGSAAGQTWASGPPLA